MEEIACVNIGFEFVVAILEDAEAEKEADEQNEHENAQKECATTAS